MIFFCPLNYVQAIVFALPHIQAPCTVRMPATSIPSDSARLLAQISTQSCLGVPCRGTPTTIYSSPTDKLSGPLNWWVGLVGGLEPQRLLQPNGEGTL